MENSIYLDASRCAGCGACAVACMDQNDIYPEKGQPAFRRIYRVEEGTSPEASILYVSASCMHCADSPCVIGCPTGSIARDGKTGAVLVDTSMCIGCHSCAMACPFGVPRYDLEDKMQKCTLCIERVQAGLRPACVRVCPTGALKFEPINEVLGEKEARLASTVISAAYRTREIIR